MGGACADYAHGGSPCQSKNIECCAITMRLPSLQARPAARDTLRSGDGAWLHWGRRCKRYRHAAQKLTRKRRPAIA
jgi:hypothetical protein